MDEEKQQPTKELQLKEQSTNRTTTPNQNYILKQMSFFFNIEFV